MDEFSNNKVDMTQRELTFIKAAEFDKGWRRGLFVGVIFVAVCNLCCFVALNFFQEITYAKYFR